MPEPFAFDSIGFLQLLNQLERRFDEVVSHAPLSFDHIDSPTIQPHTSTESSNRRTGAFHRRGSASRGRNAASERAENEQMYQTVSAQVQAQMNLFSRVDRRIDVLAQDLFGPTHWASLIRVASLGLDHDLIDEARKFMLYCSSTVRRHGMAVWLYDIMNDASMALLLHKPAEHMPVIVNGPDVVNGRLQCGLDATVQRTGPTWQRECYNRVHSLHTYMLAAYCVAKWGEPGERRRELATLMLNDWGLGMCMLREDKTVRRLGASTDMRFRRIIRYRRRLRVQADLEYAHALIDEHDASDVEEHAAATKAMDRRYLYDARKVVEAYRALWNKQTRSTRMLSGMLEETNAVPSVSLWENPLYLEDLTVSLMGAAMGSKITMGFERRNREEFEEGVRLLGHLCDDVRDLTVALLPMQVVVRFEHEIEDGGNFGLCDADDPDFWNLSQFQENVFSDMASVVLQRVFVDDDDLNSELAMAVLNDHPGTYARLIMPYFEDEDDGDVDSAELAEIVASAKEPETAPHSESEHALGEAAGDAEIIDVDVVA